MHFSFFSAAYSTLLCIVFIQISLLQAQSQTEVSFMHVDREVKGTLLIPEGPAPHPLVIIVGGSGANDRDGTLTLSGGNTACLFPFLQGETLKPYKNIADRLQQAGYAVLRYDKIEYTYPGNIGLIQFNKLWLPALSAIDFMKNRNDIDSTKIVLVGHSEGSSLIPHMALLKSGIKALVSIGGPVNALDSLLHYQLVYIAETCNGDVNTASTQGQQISAYFTMVRNRQWNITTPPLFGVPASVWYDYVQVVDSVIPLYNRVSVPQLFIGMENDYNVPPSELQLFENGITGDAYFHLFPNLNHYMTGISNPHVNTALLDTVVAFLQERVPSGFASLPKNQVQNIYPQPATNTVFISHDVQGAYSWNVYSVSGALVKNSIGEGSPLQIQVDDLKSGVYLLEVFDLTNKSKNFQKFCVH